MRRLAVIPLALLLGCWDFDSLSGGYVPPIVDASVPGDIACNKVPKQLKEDCTQQGDLNQNCLYGCDDPDCADHTACFASKGYQTYGAVAAVGGCQAPIMSTPIFQGLNTSTTCDAMCAVNSPTTTCTTTLHVFADKTTCDKGADNKITLTDGTNKCTPVTGMLATMISNYTVDKPVAGTCTPKMNSVALNATWSTNKALCDQGAAAAGSKLVRFGDMKQNGVPCVVFSGTDPAVCASTKLYPNGSVYYKGSMGGPSNCACTATTTGSCPLTNGANNAIVLTADKNCGTTTMMTPLNKEATCTASDINGGMGTAYTAMAAVTNLVAPTCSVAGTVTGQFAPANGFTLCCM